MKKNCNKCLAFRNYYNKMQCILGYRIDDNGRPLRFCSKVKTIKDLYIQLELKQPFDYHFKNFMKEHY